MAKRPKLPTAAETAKREADYHAVKAQARERANALGFDHGLEWNDLFKHHRFFMLPNREHRTGHELRCEVVVCDNVDRMQKGHGFK